MNSSLRGDRSVTAGVSSERPPRARAEAAFKDKPSFALLLDLAGDKDAASKWADALLPGADTRPIDKADLKSISRAQAVRKLRALNAQSFFIFTSDLRTQSRVAALSLFGMLAGARRVVIGDRKGNVVSRSRLGVLLLEAPRFVIEMLAGYLVILPASWLFTEALRIGLLFRKVVRGSRAGASEFALYIRATPTGTSEGGLHAHVEGFSNGAAALDHRLKLIVSGGQPDAGNTIAIQPSPAWGATKALFELWNNLHFTVKSLMLISSGALASKDIDFIYQRYSRFNWTGVVLSIVTGAPLALEYNASEVWVSRRWDPIGQLWLLKRFEWLNLKAADLIFVVSEVERRNLVDARIAPDKIMVNPNGVDTDRFRPGCGGAEIRRALGIDGEAVVGFISTFGPWHGAAVLAEAAGLVVPRATCHFLFIGDGDERPRTESIIEGAGAHADFTGRVPHDSVPAYLDACDILVSPHVRSTDGSEFFGSPLKLFEYMAMAKPVIASRVGQLADVIEDGENGLLVKPGDAAALAKAIERLAQDDALRARLGTAARRSVVERFTWRHNAARVFDAVRTLATEIER